ncbi:hypothetical protein E2C01_012348 [Portunus trituberculatus]|uniref:Uncharacterized protein n=1 Tax=Portunus trituberculatus TaxID=210409 RepID=A0A5B7DDV1_PORTR|nr:hypothetical protein [Portunus trituberculatus]
MEVRRLIVTVFTILIPPHIYLGCTKSPNSK